MPPSDRSPFKSHMGEALSEARAAAARGEAPIGAVIVDPATGAIIAAAGNETRARPDPTAHAELLAIRRAAQALGQERLTGLDLWVTLEPCPMCAGAIAHARLARVYYGAADPKGGGVAHGPCIFNQPTALWRPEVYAGVSETECAALLKDFFRALRD